MPISKNFKRIQRITDVRWGRIRKQCERGLWDKKDEIVRAIRRQPFCCGVNDRGWAIYFDWMLSEENWNKILELRYADDRKN